MPLGIITRFARNEILASKATKHISNNWTSLTTLASHSMMSDYRKIDSLQNLVLREGCVLATSRFSFQYYWLDLFSTVISSSKVIAGIRQNCNHCADTMNNCERNEKSVYSNQFYCTILGLY